jgi:hypothetical protein
MSKQTLYIGINPDFDMDYSCLSDAVEIVAWYKKARVILTTILILLDIVPLAIFPLVINLQNF